MNRDTRTVDLDTRARQAAAGLRQSVRAAQGSTRAPEPAGGRRLLALAVALALLVGGVVLFTRDNGSEEGGIATSGAATPLAPTVVPDSMAFTGAFEGPIEDDGSVPSDVSVYTSSNEVAGSDASLVGLSTPGLSNHEGSDIETVEHAGRTFYAGSPPDGETIAWDDRATGRVVVLSGRALSREQLLDTALGTTIDATGVVDIAPEAVPDGLAYLATVPYGVATPLAAAITLLDGAGGIGYADAEQTRTLEVTFALVSDGWLEASRALMYEPQSLEVRGQPAVGGRVSEETDGSTLTWVEADGTFVRLSGYGLTLDELVDVAGTLEPLTPEAWQALLDRSDEDSGGNDSGSAASGSGAETATTFRGQGQAIEPTYAPALLFEPIGDSREVASVSIASQPGSEFEVRADQMPSIQLREFEDRWIYGVVPDDTERLVLRFAGGETEVTTFQNIAGGDLFPAWAVIVEAPGDLTDYELVAYGEDGTVTTAGG